MRELCVEPEGAGGRGEGGQDCVSAEASGAMLQPLPPARDVSADFDIPNLIQEKMRSKSFFWSAEFIPGTTPQLRALLEQSLEELSSHVHLAPTFVSVTWHQSHLREMEINGSRRLTHPALALSRLFQEKYGIPALLHLSAGNLTHAQAANLLETSINLGIKNILVLRGDVVKDVEVDFRHASDLVHFIRKVFGSKFKIGVAGYPMVHPEAISQELDLLYLKKKVDQGADFILTQMISTEDEFVSYCEKCDKLGITVPIIPGIYLIQSFDSFQKFISICRINVPSHIYEDLKGLQDANNERQYGLRIFQGLFKRLQQSSRCPGVHIFTINRISSVLNGLSNVWLDMEPDSAKPEQYAEKKKTEIQFLKTSTPLQYLH